MKVKTLSITALLMAMVTVVTMYIAFPIFQGYLNLGDVMVMGMAVMLPLPMVALAGIASMFADLLLGYGVYAPFTLVIKAIEALLIAYWVSKNKGKDVPFWVYLVGGMWMALAYGVTDVIISQNTAFFFASFGYNTLQGVVCAIIAFLLFRKLRVFRDKIQS
jgi:uncharacterized membrane protein